MPARKLLERLAQSQHNINSFNLPDSISLIGRVAAGEPIEAVEDLRNFSLRDYFDGSEGTFALEVTGDSMINDGIRDGDYAICQRSQSASDGQLVIAIVDDESATLKRFYKQSSSVRLEPANEDYEPIYTDNCRIEAVVVGLVRKF